MAEHVETQAEFLDTELKPRLDAALAGDGHVFFVDAAHFVFGTFLCCLWSFARIFVRAASGRQRFNVLGAWNAVTRQLIAVTNTTVVNTETMCELLRKIAASGLTGPITLVLDNARYQRNAVVQALAKELGITLLFLPSYSPNLNLIERLWKFIKRRALYGRYHPTFAEFRAAIQEVLDGLSTTHAEQLKTLMTLKFQQFEDVSLLTGHNTRLQCGLTSQSVFFCKEPRVIGVKESRRCCSDGGGPSRQEEILETAALLFAEHSFSDAVTQALADRLGRRQGNDLRHFPGQRDLFLAAANRVMSTLQTMNNQHRPSGSTTVKEDRPGRLAPCAGVLRGASALCEAPLDPGASLLQGRQAADLL